ncbi:MAG: TIGR03905 family TSCPD domain-containing protein [Pseudoramibacter sp.]
MENYSVKTHGICSKQIDFSLEDGKLYNVHFVGGCPGNTAAIGKLLEGTDAQKAVDLLKGNPCGPRPTSCADQLARGVEQALKKINAA